jgi:hypothetical protein
MHFSYYLSTNLKQSLSDLVIFEVPMAVRMMILLFLVVLLCRFMCR